MQKSEYERLVSGEKPIAVYYRAVGEDHHYIERNKLRSEANEKRLTMKTFFIKNMDQKFRLSYEIYSNNDNSWRIDVYHALKIIGQTVWNHDLEKIEKIVLNYGGMSDNL